MRAAPRILASVAGLSLFAAMDSPAAVTFAGLPEPLEKNARALMPLASAPCNSARFRIEKLFRDSDAKLADALEALGYYKFESTKALSFDDPACWSASFDVQLGEPVRLRKVDVLISGDADDDAWISQQSWISKPVVGEVLDHGEYEKFKKIMLSAVRSRGYFEAELKKSTVTVAESLDFADIDLEVESGPRYRFGSIEYSDNILRPGLLANYATFKPGDPYDASAISKLHESLSGSGYFGAVSIQADPAKDGSHEVPVIVNLSPGLRKVYTFGLGFATDIGVQGRLGYTNRRLNDKGHQFDSRLYLSSVDSQLSGTYRWPRGNPEDEWVDVFGGYQQKTTDTSNTDKVTLGIRVSRNRSPHWLETPYINFAGENYEVGDQVDKSRLITPGIVWESTVGREISRIRSGHRISLDIRGSLDEIGSDTSFLQVTGSTKWAIPLGQSNRLLTRADLGFTAKKDFEELPASVRYFAGGDNSVRGYGFETLGPTNDEGAVVGGSYLATFSVEFDHLIGKKWSIAAFMDTGNAFDDFDVDFKTSVGLGLRWYSPLGPIRLDVAHPLDDPSRDYRLHITLGPDL
ncbi:MAG: autotransporter assembly complex protein TamA [Gammaproteobacteria bacterium]|nr:autotransporter assembly complex protein TamA [Gammaproteobacteria bacterium]MDH5215003.1 autotransporter assembly complex protein TamA [Gammaproteobacteria bacterium]